MLKHHIDIDPFDLKRPRKLLIRLRMDGVPQPQARPRLSRYGVYSPKNFWFRTVYCYAFQKKPSKPFQGPLEMRVRFYFPSQDGYQKWKSTRPDADNLAKTIMDATMKAGWFKDDGQIVSLNVQKFYGPKPGADIELRIPFEILTRL